MLYPEKPVPYIVWGVLYSILIFFILNLQWKWFTNNSEQNQKIYITKMKFKNILSKKINKIEKIDALNSFAKLNFLQTC